ncbi:MAG: hypothetical protein N3F65_03625 [Nitrososphaeria archaeon]|nr:hypothetical protein [Aigarchaeota archaeon]MCX8187681.1 hypothetical protein [Nitrososphaeria archaeon]MDW8021842.1 hypothetical protein [Nitrososphaerota archaeon]
MVSGLEALVREIIDDESSGAAQLTVRTANLFLKLIEGGKPTMRSVRKLVKLLSEARPSMPSITNMAYRISQMIDEQVSKKVDLREAIKFAVSSAIKEYQSQISSVIGNASEKLREYAVILTHSYSSTVAAALEQCRGLRVYVTESRPGMEGRRLAERLARMGLEVVLIVDSAASYVLDRGHVDAVVTGCDAILDDCSIVNKIGTKVIALAASEMGVPFIVVTDLWKAAVHGISLEERAPEEVYEGKLPNLSSLNPYFEIVPSKLITSFITDEGVLKPSRLVKKIEEMWGHIAAQNKTSLRRLKTI